MRIEYEIIKRFGKGPGKDTAPEVPPDSLQGTDLLATWSSIDRRKQDRFKVIGGAFASIKSDHDIIGPIQDISRGGFAFRYIGQEGEIYGPLEVDIYYAGSGPCVQKLTSKTVSDFKTPKKASSSSLAIRQCSVQFCELTDDQISHLDDFIQEYVDRRTGEDRRHFNDPSYGGPERRTGIERRVSPLLS